MCTKLLVRRGFPNTGRNFDVVVGVDLATRQGQRDLWSYVVDFRPLIFIMSPPCTGLKGFAALNAVIHHDAWLCSVQHSKKLGHLCGQIAQEQLRKHRHFIVEQPVGSALFELPVWRAIASQAFVVKFDQCMTGLKGRKSGMPIRKRT